MWCKSNSKPRDDAISKLADDSNLKLHNLILTFHANRQRRPALSSQCNFVYKLKASSIVNNSIVARIEAASTAAVTKNVLSFNRSHCCLFTFAFTFHFQIVPELTMTGQCSVDIVCQARQMQMASLISHVNDCNRSYRMRVTSFATHNVRTQIIYFQLPSCRYSFSASALSNRLFRFSSFFSIIAHLIDCACL